MKIVLGKPEREREEPPLYVWPKPSVHGDGVCLWGSRGGEDYSLLKLTDRGVQFFGYLPPELGLPLNEDGSIRSAKVPDANACHKVNG